MVYDAQDLTVVSRGWVDMWRLGGRLREKNSSFIEHHSPGTDTEKVEIKHDGELPLVFWREVSNWRLQKAPGESKQAEAFKPLVPAM